MTYPNSKPSELMEPDKTALLKFFTAISLFMIGQSKPKVAAILY